MTENPKKISTHIRTNELMRELLSVVHCAATCLHQIRAVLPYSLENDRPDRHYCSETPSVSLPVLRYVQQNYIRVLNYLCSTISKVSRALYCKYRPHGIDTGALRCRRAYHPQQSRIPSFREADG